MAGLEGKIALVTGSTRGIGRTIAEWLAREGVEIVVSGRAANAVAESVSAIEALGVRSWGIPADLSHASEAHRLAEATLASVPRIDLLINNAGMSIRGNFWDVTDAEFEYQTNVNYRSPFIIAQHIARHMIERKIEGRIVNFSTIGAQSCHRNAAVYDSAKGAIQTMTRNMAYELGRYRITVNCVAPGSIPDRPGSGFEPDRRKAYLKYIPVGRPGNADDIAAAVRFFCLPESSFTSGQTLLIDGAHNTWLAEFDPAEVS